MIRYMISYIDADPPRMSNGNVELTLPEPIRGMDDVNRIQQSLRERYGLANPIIMGFSVFGGDDR